MKQLNMFSMLDRTTDPPPMDTPREVKKSPPPTWQVIEGIEYLKTLISKKEQLIFIYGSNPHLRFARTSRSYEPAPPVPEGFPVYYLEARSLLTKGGYYFRGTLDSGQKIGNTGNNLIAEVWRLA